MKNAIKRFSGLVNKPVSKKIKSLEKREANQLIENLPIELAVYDLAGNYKYVNEIYIVDEQLRKNVIGKNDEYYFNQLGVSLDFAKTRKKHLATVIQNKKPVRFTEKIFFPKKGKTLYYKRQFKPLFQDNNKSELAGICLYGNDLTAFIHGQKELIYLAFHDPLTQLPNRASFYQQLDQLALDMPRNTEPKMTAVLFCDLDNFKLVNDSLGHDVGDMVLVETSKRLKSVLRKSDQVFRLGGDEFTIILRHLIDEASAAKIAMKIIKKLSSVFNLKGHKIEYITTSIGIEVLTKETFERETIVKNADMAMYGAKKQGKNQYQFFTMAMTKDAVDRLKIENNLKSLVSKEKYDKECELLYQPIIEKISKSEYKIIGLEALIRWSNQEMGEVYPATFIPVAEESNLITPIGEWIFYKACRDVKVLIEKFDPSFYVSINLSAKQLKSPELVESIKRILKDVNIKPANIQLELTETSYLDDEVLVTKTLRELKKLGLKIAIDDFGIGFASLTYLQRVPATTIKIDRSFTKNVNDNIGSGQFVKSIIDFGKNLDKEIIVEGVETRDHLSFLNKNNCTRYQGYFFSKPVTLAAIIDLLSEKLKVNE